MVALRAACETISTTGVATAADVATSTSTAVGAASASSVPLGQNGIMDTSSDYGSDTGFDDLDEDSMLTVEPKEGIDSGPTPKNSLLPRIAFERRGLGDGEQDVDDSQQILLPPLLPVSGSLVARQVYKQASVQASVARQRRALEIEYDASSRRAWSGTLRPLP